MNRLILSSALMAVAAAGAQAAVNHFAPADVLNGGLILVELQFRDPATGQCFPGQPTTGVIDGVRTPGGVPGAVARGFGWEFEIVGDHTILANWTLRNTSTDPNIFIKRIRFDLSTATIGTFFDDNSAPSTIGSFEGIDNIDYLPISTAPAPIAADETSPWVDPCNAGDLYLRSFIEWADCSFAPGQEAVWMDDTDFIPAPGAAALFAAGGLIGLRRRR